MLRDVAFVLQTAYFCIRPNKKRQKQKKFLLSFSNFCAAFVQKATFDFFGATFEQPFEKLRATFRKISSNLWQALGTVEEFLACTSVLERGCTLQDRGGA